MNTVKTRRKTEAELKQQLWGSISLFLIALIALTSATYAWFTFVSNPEIGNIDMKVSAADELYLSPYHSVIMDPEMQDYGTIPYGGASQDDPFYDPSIWFATITQPMLQDVADPSIPAGFKQTSGFPIANVGLKDLSSIFTMTNRNYFKRDLNEQGYPTAYSPAGSPPGAAGYVSFDLWAKSSNSGVVYLDSSDNNWVKAINSLGAASNTFSLADTKKEFIKSTARVGFYTANEGNATSGDPRAVIWEPNSGIHLPAEYGGTTSDGVHDTTMAITTADSITYPGELITEGGKTAQKTFDFPIGTTKTTNIAGESQKIALFYLEAGRAVKFTITIWVEGADSDTLNAVAGSFFRTYMMLGQDSTLEATDIIN